MTTPRENLLRLLRREGFDAIPPDFVLCPSQQAEFHRRYGADAVYQDVFGFAWRNVNDITLPENEIDYAAYYREQDRPLKAGSEIDLWGVGHETGSSEACHMTYMRHPMEHFDSLEQFEAFPYPAFDVADDSHQAAEVDAIHTRGLAAVGWMQMTIWEAAWYMRSMPKMMMDMAFEDPKAVYHLDRITSLAIARAEAYARAGCDCIYLGDDIGMQERIMMSKQMYRTWLLPRLQRVTTAIKAINPDCVILYHSCGFVEPLIDDLLEGGIEVLNPIQPESMDFAEIHAKYGDRVSFHGAIGTQTTMPFGTPQEVKDETHRLLDIAGPAGGLLVGPTHIIEPEVPFDNIEAYVEACHNYC